MDEFCGSAARGDHVEPTSAYRQFLWQPENAICNWIAMVVVIEHPSVKSTLGQDGLNFGKIQTDESIIGVASCASFDERSRSSDNSLRVGNEVHVLQLGYGVESYCT